MDFVKFEESLEDKTVKYGAGALIDPYVNITSYTPSFSYTASKFPDQVDYRNMLPPPISQGKRSTCEACVGSVLASYKYYKIHGKKEYFSPDFIYYYRKNKPEPGMYDNNLMDLLKKRGCCKNKYYPYSDDSTKDHPPSQEAKDKAKNSRITGYYSIKLNSKDDLKNALIENGPCLMTLPYYNYEKDFWNKHGKKLRGYHAVTITGYTNTGFKLMNSWGKDWNNNGYTTYSYKDFDKKIHLSLLTCTGLNSENFTLEKYVYNPFINFNRIDYITLVIIIVLSILMYFLLTK